MKYKEIKIDIFELNNNMVDVKVLAETIQNLAQQLNLVDLDFEEDSLSELLGIFLSLSGFIRYRLEECEHYLLKDTFNVDNVGAFIQSEGGVEDQYMYSLEILLPLIRKIMSEVNEEDSLKHISQILEYFKSIGNMLAKLSSRTDELVNLVNKIEPIHRLIKEKILYHSDIKNEPEFNAN